jgi:plasmid stabilization system protein ParE
MARARRLIWSPASQRDLLDIHRYYSRVASPEIADNLLLEIDVGASSIGSAGFVGRSARVYQHPLRTVRALLFRRTS